jgi:hypothetical protein
VAVYRSNRPDYCRVFQINDVTFQLHVTTLIIFNISFSLPIGHLLLNVSGSTARLVSRCRVVTPHSSILGLTWKTTRASRCIITLTTRVCSVIQSVGRVRCILLFTYFCFSWLSSNKIIFPSHQLSRHQLYLDLFTIKGALLDQSTLLTITVGCARALPTIGRSGTALRTIWRGSALGCVLRGSVLGAIWRGSALRSVL